MIDLFTKNSSGLNEKDKKDFSVALSGLTGANIEEILVDNEEIKITLVEN